MTLEAWVILGALVVVIAVQLVHRVAGAALAVLWTVALAWWGWGELQSGKELRFFFLKGDPRSFWMFMGAFLAYNVFALVRAIGRRPRRSQTPIDASRPPPGA